MYEEIKGILDSVPGKIGFYYKDLKSDKCISFNEDERFLAASIIKLPILVETLRQREEGILEKDMKVKVLKSDKVPSCGALNYLHDEIEVTIEDLYTLMIILSDNTATNMLMNILGIDNVNKTILDLNLSNTKLSRLLYDSQGKKEGKENYFSPKDIGELLERVYKGKMINKYISEEMQRVMKMQLMDSKMPYLLPEDLEIAHKTGEDTGISHDVGIVYSKNPFIFCFASNGTNVPMAEDALRRIALLCYENSLD